MTREDAIYYLQSSGFSEEQINTIEQAFIPKPCVDAISRQVVIKHLHNEYHGMISDESMKIYEIINMLKEQPSVTPKPRKGHWISHREHCENLGVMPSGLGSYFWCSECDCGIDSNYFHRVNYNYCPNCGADMREVEE